MAQSPDARGCPLCGGGSRRRLVTRRGFEVVRCAGCGLVYVWPPPTPEELDAVYASGDYHAEVDEAERRRTFAARLRQVEELAPRRGRVLDVGCSKGTFLEVARAEGWDAVGVDRNPHAAEAARARGLDVRCGDLIDWEADPAAQGRPEPGSFDVITLFDLIEHTTDPRATLAACRRLLRPGGLLVITTPNIEGLVPTVTYWLFARTLGAWDHPTPPAHVVQFGRRTLQQILEQADFKIVRWRAEHIPVAYSAGKLENAVMDVLAGRHRTKRQPKSKAANDFGGGGPPPPAGRASVLRRTIRLTVRGVAWLVVGGAGLAARATGWGDSMLAIARRLE